MSQLKSCGNGTGECTPYHSCDGRIVTNKNGEFDFRECNFFELCCTLTSDKPIKPKMTEFPNSCGLRNGDKTTNASGRQSFEGKFCN